MRTSRYTVILSIATLVTSLAATAGAAEPPQTLPLCPEEFQLQTLPTQSAIAPALTLANDTEITTDNVRITAEGASRVAGNVQIRSGERRLRADALQYDATGNRITVQGNIEYSEPELVLRGAAGEFEGGAARIDGAEFELPTRPARGAARSLDLSPTGVLKLQGVRYTTCLATKPDWQLSVSEVSVDSRKGVGVARDARLHFKGVPILRVPWLSFPVGSTRKTGFLFPSIGSSSRGGLQLTAPYYLDLAPNLDATLTPTIYSRRGLDLGAELRYLSAHSQGELSGNFLPSDRSYDAARHRIRLTGRTLLPRGWRLDLNAENVGDAQYFEDFSQGADGASIAFLPRAAHLSWQSDHLQLGAWARNFQTIDQALPSIDRPYTELPRLYAQGQWRQSSASPLTYGFSSELTAFHRNQGVEGTRLDMAPQLALRFERPGYYMQPQLEWRSTHYRLSGVGTNADREHSRSLPTASLDAGLAFERSVGSTGQRRITLEPRLLYQYTPYRNQDALPVFDSGEPDLNWVELFRTNRYVGLDRIGDANQLALGLTSRLFSSRSGTRYLAATVGQTIYFEPPRVRMPEEPPRDPKRSDLIAQLSLQAFQNWSADLGMQWDHQRTQAERSEVRLQYRPASAQVINLGYRFQRDRSEQVDFSVAWPISAQWKVYGRTLYSLRDSQSIETFGGFEYSSCCWGIRAVARDYVSRRSGERDRGIYLQLELKGLSNVGLAADAFLERAIRGYSPSRRSRPSF